MNVNNAVRNHPEESRVVSCISSVIGAGAFVVYGIIELTKWAFNNLKNFFYYLGLNLWEYSHALFRELEKFSVSFGEALAQGVLTISHVVYLLLRNLWPLFSAGFNQIKAAAPDAIHAAVEISEPIIAGIKLSVRAASEYMPSGFYQLGCLITDAPSSLHETVAPAHELACALYKELESYWVSLKSGAKTLFLESLSTSTEAGVVTWSLMRGEVYECLDIAAAGCREIFKFCAEVPHVLNESTHGMRELIRHVIFNLLDYLSSGMHQLVSLADSVAPIIVTILLSAKEVILEVIKELILLFSCGFEEFKKAARVGVEIYFEGVSLVYHFAKEITLVLWDFMKTCGRETVKGLVFASESAALILEVAGVIRRCVKEILAAGLEQMQRLIISVSVAILDKIPYSLFLSILENVLDYLSAGASQFNRFLIEGTYLVIEGYILSKELIGRIAKEVYDMMGGSLSQGVKLAVEGTSTALEATKVTLEMVAAVVENLFYYLESGYTQSLVFGMLLKEDLPDTYRYLVQDPLERFFAPKYRWVKERVLELRRRSAERMARIKEATYRKFGEIRDATQRRIEEIRRRVFA